MIPSFLHWRKAVAIYWEGKPKERVGLKDGEQFGLVDLGLKFDVHIIHLNGVGIWGLRER